MEERTGESIMAEWKTEWTGSYPNLCSGSWILYKDGVEIPLTESFPFGEDWVSEEEAKEEFEDGKAGFLYFTPADTFGTYSTWHFEDWMEVFEDYEDGLLVDAWIKEYKDWLMEIDPSGNDWKDIYAAFCENDWRHNSCGGCI